MSTVVQQSGQSLLDLCLQVGYTLDQLIGFASDNKVSQLGNIPQSASYKFSPEQVKYEGNTNTYATDYRNTRFFDQSFFDNNFFQ